MNKRFSILAVSLSLSFTACQMSDFEKSYTDPSKISVSSVEKQFSGFLQANKAYVVPDYTNYFVVNRITLNRYSQVVGWVNSENQYVPGSAAIGERWKTYYDFLTQYREMEKIYNALNEVDKADRRIYIIAATAYLYEHTQKMVDLHGDIPFFEAGKLSTNGGNYSASYPKYDTAEAIYTKMLDDLKGYSDELNTLTVKSGIATGFKTQDFVMNGDMSSWKRYVNSLRLRMLTRVSGTQAFAARAKAEMAQILGDAAKYPVVTHNVQNIMIDIQDLGSPINSKGFQTGLEDWNGNVAGKLMIDQMNANMDPRLRYLFEPGTAADGVYEGLDPMATASVQTEKIASNKMTIYNRSTVSRNQYFPGLLITAAEVSLLSAEYYLNAGNDAMAATHYQNAIKQSIEMYVQIRAMSNDNTVPAPAAVKDAEITTYLNSSAASWTKATTAAQKLSLIANQRWLHFNVIQPDENWAEIRRLDSPSLTFWTDNSGTQKTVPVRWFYPGSEQSYNTANYSLVKSKDNLSNKLFWDLK
jgi:hypothetical protein